MVTLTSSGSLARAEPSMMSLPPNKRLKLPAPVVCGNIAFVNVLVRRRSLSAIR